MVENLKFWVGKDRAGRLNPRSFWVWEGEGEHGLGSFGKEVALREVVEAIDGGAELRGMKIDEQRVVVAVSNI